MLLYALYLHFIIRIYPLLCSSSRTIMYFVEVRYGLYDLERSKRKMGRNTSTDKLLLRRWAYSWGHKDGNDLVNT